MFEIPVSAWAVSKTGHEGWGSVGDPGQILWVQFSSFPMAMTVVPAPCWLVLHMIAIRWAFPTQHQNSRLPEYLSVNSFQIRCQLAVATMLLRGHAP